MKAGALQAISPLKAPLRRFSVHFIKITTRWTFKIILVKWRFSKGNPIISGKSRLVKYYLGGGCKGFFIFTPILGEMIHFD